MRLALLATQLALWILFWILFMWTILGTPMNVSQLVEVWTR